MSKDKIAWRLLQVCVRNLFVFIYFSTSSSFSHEHSSSHTCSHLHYAPTTCFSPFILFHFHHSHQVQTIEKTSKVNSNIYQRQEYLLARLFARHLLPSDTVSQGFTKRQLPRPLLHKLMMRLYISRYQVQGDSQRQQSLTMG